MESLILELQKDGMNPSIEVSSLLRKAYVVAKKLKVNDFADWLSKELNGFNSGDEIPNYRKVQGTIKAHNPFHGWVPVILQDTEMAENLSTRMINQSIPELENVIKNAKDRNIDYGTIRFPNDIERLLMSTFEVELVPQLLVDNSQIHKIIESVRNTVLEWALKLEEDGILGEGMTFSEKEQEKASTTTYHITNNIGYMTNSQLQQHTINSNQTMEVKGFDYGQIKQFISEVKRNLEKLDINDDAKEELVTDIQTVELQLNSSKPKDKIIKEGLASIRNILEGIGGSLIASGLLEHFPNLTF
jgi:hypothetical protein